MDRSQNSFPHEAGMRDSFPSCSGASLSAGGLTRTETLSPEKWSKLPEAVIRIVIHKVLADLPFGRHWAFCCDSSRWKEYLLSNRYLVFYEMGRCIIFNLRRRKWESVSLDFCPLVRKEWCQHLRFISADGGLVTFFNKLNDQYFVCNLLTQRYANLGARCPSLCTESSSTTAVTMAIDTEFSPNTEEYTESPPAFSTDPITFKVDHGGISRNGRPYKLGIARYHTGSLLVVDSRLTGLGTFYTPIEGPFWTIVNRPILRFPDAVIVGFRTDAKVSIPLIYDLEEKSFKWASAETLLHAITRTGKVLAIGSESGAQMMFFEVFGAALEMTPMESPFQPLPLSLLSIRGTFTIPEHLEKWQHKRLFLVLLCGAAGDLVDYLLFLGHGASGLWGQVDAIAVSRDGQVSDWSIQRPLLGGVMSFPEFYVFQPCESGPA